ncbi:hypothetical protein [Jiulongibacter sp. NS-SX5]|uniref:hypothetical protein n=1 Tax=Jiulongibacter sp. NS-SX5 TaxID=3463854 RepID=UPI004059532B
MKKDIKEIIESLQNNEKKYYVDKQGYIMERINPAYDEKTGYYINDNGEYVRETNALNFDQKTGLYEDEKGDIREKSFFFNDKTGYYKEKDKYKKEGFFGRDYSQRSRNENRSSSFETEDDISTVFFLVKWGIIVSIAVFVLLVAVFLAPLILLVWYIVRKRETHWVAILGMLFSAYLIYDLNIGGVITNSMMKMQRTGEEKYIALIYFVIFATTLGLFVDKYSSIKIPFVENGNFFERKILRERRPYVVGFCVLLLAVFSTFQFKIFTNGNGHNNPNMIVYESDLKDRSIEIKVSNLRVRNKPSLDADRIDSMNPGDHYPLTGNRSVSKTTVQIKGQSIDDYWFEAYLENGGTGWVHGCCISIE